MERKSITLVAPVFPYPPDNGVKKRMYDMAVHLSEAYDLHFVVLENGRIEEERIEELKGVASSVEVVMHPASNSLLLRNYHRLLKRIKGPDPFLRHYCPGTLRRSVKNTVERTGAAAAVANYPILAPSLYSLDKKVLTVVDTHDVWHEKYLNFKKMGKGRILEHFREEQTEARLMEPCNVVMAITKRDKAVFEGMMPGKRVIVCGVSYPASDAIPQESGSMVLMVGGRGANNEDALAYFLKEIWPGVLQARNDAGFHVIGCAEETIKKWRGEKGVFARGYMKDLDKWYGRAAVVVVPLRHGTGFKIKVGEALSRGCAVVMTSAAAQGLAPGNGDCFLIRDGAEAFSRAITDLLSNGEKRRRMKENALDYSRRYFNPAYVYRELLEVLEDEITA